MTNKEITDYIFIEDKNLKGDIGLVFGTGHSWKIATEKAVDLYKKGFVPKIIFSGGVNKFTDIAEAEIMSDEAIKMGVPKEDIFIENKATNTSENVLFSLEKIKNEVGLEKINTVVAVVKNYHARRALMTLRKNISSNIKIKSAPYTSILYNFTKDDWSESDVGKEQVKKEMGKIKLYLEKGDLVEI